jgi:hypothetical protein
MAAAPTLTLRDLNRATLARQLLLAREKITPVAAVEKLFALQGQVARPPFVGLWTRLEEVTRAGVHRLFQERKLVRGTFLRGTLHVTSDRDFRQFRGAIQPALTAGMLAILRERAEGLDIAGLRQAAVKFLARAPATFEGIRDHLLETFPGLDERAMGYAVRMHLPLLQVPTDDRWAFPSSAAFTPADEWIGKPLSTDEEPRELVKRYLAAFGPATPGDAQAWSALKGLKATFEALRPELVTFRDERRRELFDLPDAPRPGADADAPVRFLPDFDNLVLGHDDRTRVLSEEHKGRVVTKNLLVRATFLVDGFVAGTWKIERKKDAATLLIEPFGKLPVKVRRALEGEAGPLVRFVEEDAKTWAVAVAEAG